MTIQTAAGGRLYIGTNAVIDFGDDVLDATIAAAVEADSLVEINEIENAGKIGDTSGVTKFTALKDSRVRKLKTTKDAGDPQIIMAMDSVDQGQQDLVAAMDDPLAYNFKYQFNDAPADASPNTPTVIYFRALVSSKEIDIGQVDNVVRRAVTLNIDSRVVEIPAA